MLSGAPRLHPFPLVDNSKVLASAEQPHGSALAPERSGNGAYLSVFETNLVPSQMASLTSNGQRPATISAVQWYYDWSRLAAFPLEFGVVRPLSRNA